MRTIWICAAALSVGLGGCSASDSALINKAQTSVKLKLKDPESAKFNNEYVLDSQDVSDRYSKLRYACGEVNAKNGFGGYSGPVRYVALLAIAPGESIHQVIEVDLEPAPGDYPFTASFWPNCVKTS